MEATPGEAPSTTTLELLYEEVIRESDRLRNARGAFSRQLGPLPASGAVVLGLYNAFTKHPPNPLSWVAAGLFALSVVVSVALSGLSPYRRMRAAVLQENADWRRPELAGAADERLPETVLDKEAWLRKRIALERRLYGKAESSAALWRIRWVGQPENLQEAFERERYGVLAVQLLVVAEVVLLFLATTL